MAMVCPRCGKSQDVSAECAYCGVVIAKYQRLQAEAETASRQVEPPQRRDEGGPAYSTSGIGADTKAAILRFGLIGAGVVGMIWWLVPSQAAFKLQQRYASEVAERHRSVMDREREAMEPPPGWSPPPAPVHKATSEPKEPPPPPAPSIPLPPNGPFEPCREGPGGLVIKHGHGLNLPRLYSDQAPAQLHVVAKLVGPVTCEIMVQCCGDYGIKLPEGRYTFRWAAGRTWMGRDDYFGPDTAFFEADSPVELSEQYTRSLTLDTRFGNTGKSSISRSRY